MENHQMLFDLQTPQRTAFYMENHQMLVDLQTRCIQSDERKQEEAIQFKDSMTRIYAFVEKNLSQGMDEGVRHDMMVKDVANLAYCSTLPLLKQVPINIFKSMRPDNPHRVILFSACLFARGLTLKTEIAANDSDWVLWVESL
jgi:hypothetical protein